MKHFLTSILVTVLILIIPTGCSTTRKTTQSSTTEQITSQATVTSDTDTESKDALDTRLNLSEQLSAIIDFTRYEFTDGTVLTETTPAPPADKTSPRNREQTEPPNPGKGLKAVTVGHINLNKASEQTEETQANTETKTESSLTSQNNTTFDISHDTKTTEKPKRGVLHTIGAITVSIIAVVLIIFFIRWLIRRKKFLQESE